MAELVKERYLISKNLNTSYVELGKITPLEKNYLLKYIKEDFDKQKEIIDARKQKGNK